MAITGVVEQTAGGQVLSCTLAQKCYEANGQKLQQKKFCLLSVDHGDRCTAWAAEKFRYLIDEDPSKIKSLP
jgi:hypothetical protein